MSSVMCAIWEFNRRTEFAREILPDKIEEVTGLSIVYHRQLGVHWSCGGSLTKQRGETKLV